MGGKGGKAAAGAVALVVLAVVMFLTTLSGDNTASACPTSPGGAGMGVTGPTGVSLAGMNQNQLQLARNGVAIGKQRAMPQSVILSELAAAATESTFRNLANSNVPESLQFAHDGVGHDYDSVGPHQLRASIWGAVGMAKLMDPVYQINWFYDQAAKVPGYQSMDPAALAQKVEVSAPDAYAGQMEVATKLYETFKDVTPGDVPPPGDQCSTGGPMFTPGGPFGQNVIAAAMRWVNTTPYAWGGGNQNGPTHGQTDNGGAGDAHGDTSKIGFDCSGLTLYAVYQASGGKILLPHYTGDHSGPHPNPGQLYDPRGQAIPFDQKQPGDLIFFGSGGDSHHVGIYYGKDDKGNDLLLNAPESGKNVSIMPLSDWNGETMYVRRFGS